MRENKNIKPDEAKQSNDNTVEIVLTIKAKTFNFFKISLLSDIWCAVVVWLIFLFDNKKNISIEEVTTTTYKIP